MSESPGEIGATSENTNPRNAGAKRKRLAGTSTTSQATRSVANLTPDQLEKKRKNDREAQRAIRERTKAHIDRLNDRIQDLEQSDAFQQLQSTIRQKDAIQAENDELKRKMAQVISLLQSHVVSGQGLDDLALAAERKGSGPKSPLPPVQHQQQYGGQAPSPVPSIQSPVSQSSHTRTYATSSSVIINNQHIPPLWGSPSSSFDHHGGTRSLAIDHELLRESQVKVGFVLDHTDHFVRGTINTSDKLNSALPPVHAMLPRASAQDSCPLDKLLLDFLLKTQRLAASGVSTKDLAGPAYPNWNVMVNPNTRHRPHLLSKVFTDILLTFPDLSDPPVQVAVVFIMFLVMRWQIDPTRDNYERIPEWIRPRPEQIFVYHPHWLDYLPWPLLRTAAVMRKPQVDFDNFFIPYTTSISLNWPYTKESVLSPSIEPSTPTSPYDEPIYTINPAFEAHLRDLNNWSLGPEFRRAFPEWGDFVRISEQ